MSDERFDPKEQPAELPPRKWPEHKPRQPPANIPSHELAEKVGELLENFDDVVPKAKPTPPPRRKLSKPIPPETEGDDYDRGQQ